MSDHKDEAQRLEEQLVSGDFAGESGHRELMARMNMQATLAAADETAALVAQQKLANQMAYLESLATVERDGYVLNQEGREDMATLHVAIREGLGLA